MTFEEALKSLLTHKTYINRENWPYTLHFDMRSGDLIIRDKKGETFPYVISEYDFNYKWDKAE
jgi:hypothetical protein